MERWKYILGMFSLVVILVGLALASVTDKKLHLVACNVGQGDAILAVYGEIQILVDGGPDRRVLDCLSEHLPFWDREIELVVLTHPQKDHFGGLIEVFKTYKVDNFASTALDSSSQEFKVLKNQVGSSGARVVNPNVGMEIAFDLIHLDMVHPSYAFLASEGTPSSAMGGEGVLGAYTSGRDPNDFSIVAILRFKNFDALLTGDISPEVMNEVLSQGRIGDVEYIKIPHHGSKNGLTKELLDTSTPDLAVISVGKNSYGHPHQEVLKLLSDRGIKTFRTDEVGDVEVTTDGIRWEIDGK